MNRSHKIILELRGLPPPPPPPPPPPASPTPSTADRVRGWIKTGAEVATAGVFVVALFQWNLAERAATSAEIAATAAKTSADVAAEALWLTQRANLSLERWDLSLDDAPPDITHVIRNSGPTAAQLDRVQYAVEIGALPPTPTWDADIQKFGTPVGAGATVLQPHTLRGDLGPAVRTAIAQGTDWWFAVRLEYSDDFGRYATCTVVASNEPNRGTLVVFPADGYHCNETIARKPPTP